MLCLELNDKCRTKKYFLAFIWHLVTEQFDIKKLSVEIYEYVNCVLCLFFLVATFVVNPGIKHWLTSSVDLRINLLLLVMQ